MENLKSLTANKIIQNPSIFAPILKYLPNHILLTIAIHMFMIHEINPYIFEEFLTHWPTTSFPVQIHINCLGIIQTLLQAVIAEKIGAIKIFELTLSKYTVVKKGYDVEVLYEDQMKKLITFFSKHWPSNTDNCLTVNVCKHNIPDSKVATFLLNGYGCTTTFHPDNQDFFCVMNNFFSLQSQKLKANMVNFQLAVFRLIIRNDCIPITFLRTLPDEHLHALEFESTNILNENNDKTYCNDRFIHVAHFTNIQKLQIPHIPASISVSDVITSSISVLKNLTTLIIDSSIMSVSMQCAVFQSVQSDILELTFFNTMLYRKAIHIIISCPFFNNLKSLTIRMIGLVGGINSTRNIKKLKYLISRSKNLQFLYILDNDISISNHRRLFSLYSKIKHVDISEEFSLKDVRWHVKKINSRCPKYV